MWTGSDLANGAVLLCIVADHPLDKKERFCVAAAPGGYRS